MLFPGKNHSEFYRAFTDTPDSFHRYYRSWNRAPNQHRLIDRLRQYFSENSSTDHLVSSEDICLLSATALRNLKTFLTQECNFSTVAVVCFLREPLDYLNSSLQQYIKPGLVTLNEILSDSLESYQLQGCPEFNGGLENILTQIYFPVPDKLIEAFGSENIRFIKFENAVETGLVESLLVNLSDSKNLDISYTGQSNQSMSHESCLLLAEHNNRHPLLLDDKTLNDHRVTSRVASVLRGIPGRPARLINPSALDFDRINGGISRINSTVGFEVMAPILNIPDKYLDHDMFEFSEDAMAAIRKLTGKSGGHMPLTGGLKSTKHLQAINALIERKYRNRWWHPL